MRFADWYWLFLLGLIPLVYRFFYFRNQPPSVSFSVPLKASVSKRSLIHWILGFKFLAIILLIFILARPQNSYKKVERTVSGVDIMMLLDVSPSMQIEDLGERTRLEIAKQTMQDFIQGRGNDRIGLVIFSGEGLTLAPPTLDYGLLMSKLQQAKTGVLKDGTAIGDGLAIAVSHLRLSQAKSRIVVLLTDGDSNLGQIDPVTAGDLAAGYGIKVYTIAIGREGRVKIPMHGTLFGQSVRTYQVLNNTLNPKLLQEISEKTSGKFYRVTEEKTLDLVFKEIDLLEKTKLQSYEKIKYEEVFQGPLIVLLFLLGLIQILERTVWRFAL